MARPRSSRNEAVLTEADWSKGIVRDAPRSSIPESSLWDSEDFLFHRPGIAQKRGGAVYAGPALGDNTRATMVAWAPYPAGSQLVAIGGGSAGAADNNLYTVTSGTTTDKGDAASEAVGQSPVFRVNLLVIPFTDGTAPRKYDGSAAPAALGGSPPSFRYAALYKTRIVGGATSANPNRIWFSETPNIEDTWDTANNWIDMDNEVTGFASLPNVLLVFSEGYTERILGSIPPADPGFDMDKAIVGAEGCTDARSIVTIGGNVIFANGRGIHLTNGAGFQNLTEEGGVGIYWQELLDGYNRDTWVISAGLYRGFYVVSVLDNNGALKATFMCHIRRRAFWKLTNIRANMFASQVGEQDELYYADRASARILALSDLFSPTAANKNDANGTAVTPMMELRMLGQGPGVKHFGFGRCSYFLKDAATDNPTLAVTVARGLRAGSFAAVPESPLPETGSTDVERVSFRVAEMDQGVTVRIEQNNASAETEIYAVEVEQRQLPLVAGGRSAV